MPYWDLDIWLVGLLGTTHKPFPDSGNPGGDYKAKRRNALALFKP